MKSEMMTLPSIELHGESNATIEKKMRISRLRKKKEFPFCIKTQQIQTIMHQTAIGVTR